MTVLGCGRWGAFHAWHAAQLGATVTLWGREHSKNLETLKSTRKNDFLTLPEEVTLTDDLLFAVENADVLMIVIKSQAFREFVGRLAKIPGAKEKRTIIAMKGLEAETGKRLSEVYREEMGGGTPVIWVGPGHVQDFYRGVPGCMVMASADEALTRETAELFQSPLIRFYYGSDLIGAEIGAAAKNVMGLAAGMLDGFGYTSLKGPLMARGAREVARFIKAAGGNAMTAYGLSHLGDYEATLFSDYSNNRRFGRLFVLGDHFDRLAEGVDTVRAMVRFADDHDVDIPISRAVYAILYQRQDPKEVLSSLFLRPPKAE